MPTALSPRIHLEDPPIAGDRSVLLLLLINIVWKLTVAHAAAELEICGARYARCRGLCVERKRTSSSFTYMWQIIVVKVDSEI